MPKFSKQHYEAFAELLREEKGKTDYERLVRRISEMFAADNPNFDPERFSTAAGYTLAQEDIDAMKSGNPVSHQEKEEEHYVVTTSDGETIYEGDDHRAAIDAASAWWSEDPFKRPTPTIKRMKRGNPVGRRLRIPDGRVLHIRVVEREDTNVQS